ncbi:hypothetical protein AB4K20DRAFT_1863056 [Rhizopus microsporus]|uniref:Uncharacterized protein n=1 Tax=Rhizopus microsporus TaxID=58291 RepID=A0A1X0RQG3_RHIZD|nr:hypothetical protein BCV71DRAFT_238556 [Rhizopus microsporus]
MYYYLERPWKTTVGDRSRRHGRGFGTRLNVWRISLWHFGQQLLVLYSSIRKTWNPCFLGSLRKPKARIGSWYLAWGADQFPITNTTSSPNLGLRRKIDLSKRLSVIMACGGMSIEFTENGRLLRPGFTEAVKAFYGYAAIWLLIMGLLSLSGITLLEFEILPDSTTGDVGGNFILNCEPCRVSCLPVEPLLENRDTNAISLNSATESKLPIFLWLEGF